MSEQPAKQLRRSTSAKMIAGVCGGLGDYLNMDPLIVRIGFVVLTVVVGVGPLLYIAMWILVPEDTAA